MRALLLPLAAVLLVAPAAAGQRSQLALEANIVQGTVSYARATSPGKLIGVELGVGFPQLDVTLAPADEDFMGIFHLGVFRRWLPSERGAVDAGVRVGLADLHECGASDCLPGVYASGTAQASFGWRRVKLGPRVQAGVIRESGRDGTFFTVIQPLNVTIYHSW